MALPCHPLSTLLYTQNTLQLQSYAMSSPKGGGEGGYRCSAIWKAKVRVGIRLCHWLLLLMVSPWNFLLSKIRLAYFAFTMLAQSSKTQTPIVRKFPPDAHILKQEVVLMKYHSFLMCKLFPGWWGETKLPIFRTIPYDHHHAITLIPGHSTQHKFHQIRENVGTISGAWCWWWK